MAFTRAGPFVAAPRSISLRPIPRRTLLIVDDEPLLAEFMASVAEDAGWATELALSADEFDAKLEECRPDVLALDLAMPGRDGVEVLRLLAANGFSGRLIIVSACDQPIVESSARLAREHGLSVLGYMQKPITAEAFNLILDQAEASTVTLAFDSRH